MYTLYMYSIFEMMYKLLFLATGICLGLEGQCVCISYFDISSTSWSARILNYAILVYFVHLYFRPTDYSSIKP